ncbi:MAG: hypothetical protein HY544_02030 [Candidatus Diapherotrites archaeon]|uniref:Uncharacterized protein n=1 Tax=Candidatus Iainarchaeum sp. TaxID=3101447 RepID=A0A8T3YI98_9ARCH|nr:hypothetical protein [Candidatus Diapherotrites archaeon]
MIIHVLLLVIPLIFAQFASADFLVVDTPSGQVKIPVNSPSQSPGPSDGEYRTFNNLEAIAYCDVGALEKKMKELDLPSGVPDPSEFADSYGKIAQGDVILGPGRFSKEVIERYPEVVNDTKKNATIYTSSHNYTSKKSLAWEIKSNIEAICDQMKRAQKRIRLLNQIAAEYDKTRPSTEDVILKQRKKRYDYYGGNIDRATDDSIRMENEQQEELGLEIMGNFFLSFKFSFWPKYNTAYSLLTFAQRHEEREAGGTVDYFHLTKQNRTNLEWDAFKVNPSKEEIINIIIVYFKKITFSDTDFLGPGSIPIESSRQVEFEYNFEKPDRIAKQAENENAPRFPDDEFFHQILSDESISQTTSNMLVSITVDEYDPEIAGADFRGKHVSRTTLPPTANPYHYIISKDLAQMKAAAKAIRQMTEQFDLVQKKAKEAMETYKKQFE